MILILIYTALLSIRMVPLSFRRHVSHVEVLRESGTGDKVLTPGFSCFSTNSLSLFAEIEGRRLQYQCYVTFDRQVQLTF